MSLPDLITHIIIEDTNWKECASARAKALSAKANTIEDRPSLKRYEKKPDHKKINLIFPSQWTQTHLQEEGKLLCLWKARSPCTSVQT